jgi:hypothetical protein
MSWKTNRKTGQAFSTRARSEPSASRRIYRGDILEPGYKEVGSKEEWTQSETFICPTTGEHHDYDLVDKDSSNPGEKMLKCADCGRIMAFAE